MIQIVREEERAEDISTTPQILIPELSSTTAMNEERFDADQEQVQGHRRKRLSGKKNAKKKGTVKNASSFQFDVSAVRAPLY